ncbi:MAG: hypothetical protein U0930_22665 [Pirellulales bacterium]
MPKLQCPKCKQPIEIKAVPADNKVKCGSCSAEFTLKSPAKTGAATASASSSKPGAASGPAKPSSANSGAAKAGAAKPVSATSAAPAKQTATKPTIAAQANAAAVDPNDPFAAIDLNNIGKAKRVDFGVAPIPTGVAESPIGNNAPWLAENKPAYKPLSEQEAAAMAAGNPYQAAEATATAKPRSQTWESTSS